MRENIAPPADRLRWVPLRPTLRRWHHNRVMERQPMPGLWIAVQIAIVICVLISAVIVIVKL
jgi:hypothetical protein